MRGWFVALALAGCAGSSPADAPDAEPVPAGGYTAPVDASGEAAAPDAEQDAAPVEASHPLQPVGKPCSADSDCPALDTWGSADVAPDAYVTAPMVCVAGECSFSCLDDDGGRWNDGNNLCDNAGGTCGAVNGPGEWCLPDPYKRWGL